MRAADAATAVLQALNAGRPVPADSMDALVAKAKRFDFVQPIVTGGDDEVTNRRTQMIAMGLIAGYDGEELIDWAMRRCVAVGDNP